MGIDVEGDPITIAQVAATQSTCAISRAFLDQHSVAACLCVDVTDHATAAHLVVVVVGVTVAAQLRSSIVALGARPIVATATGGVLVVDTVQDRGAVTGTGGVASVVSLVTAAASEGGVAHVSDYAFTTHFRQGVEGGGEAEPSRATRVSLRVAALVEQRQSATKVVIISSVVNGKLCDDIVYKGTADLCSVVVNLTGNLISATLGSYPARG